MSDDTTGEGGGSRLPHGAGVVEADMRAANGVIHKIDTLLLPQNLELPAPAEEGDGD